MRNTYAHLKSYGFYVMLLFGLLLFVQACKKDSPATEAESQTALIDDARNYFEENVLNKLEAIPNDQNYRHALKKSLLWEKAKTKQISLGEAVIVPIKYDKKLFFSADQKNQSIQSLENSYLMIYKDRKRKFRAEWVTVIPDHSQKGSAKFVGTVLVEDWVGHFVKAFAFGKTGDVVPVKLTASELYTTIGMRRLSCYTIRYYGHNYVEGVANSDYWYENGSETYCLNESGIDYGPYGDMGDMGSGGGGGAGSGDYTSVLDCNGDVNGSAYTADCGCIGGNTGTTECAQKNIIDSLRGYPCAQNLLRQLPNLNTQIASLVKNTFGITDNINLTFKVNQALAGTTIDGQTISGNFVAGIVDEEIVELNPDVLKNSSQEYILVTLYHEALHAYFNKMSHQLSPTEFANRFGSLSVNGGRTLFTEVSGHFEMAANNYLNGLRNAILTFNPNYDVDRAYSLAKVGVVLSNSSDKVINDQERDTRTLGYTGTKCP
ncbi:hypothetical protein [Pedobacter sp.]|uniref:hypothetical protein n=1 Tax=Pedobacter sp. TaxID=1411316 RepID=UPI003BAC22E5